MKKPIDLTDRAEGEEIWWKGNHGTLMKKKKKTNEEKKQKTKKTPSEVDSNASSLNSLWPWNAVEQQLPQLQEGCYCNK